MLTRHHHIELLRKHHRKISKHRKQDTRYGITHRESDPWDSAPDFDRGLAAETGMGASTCHAAHQHRGVDFEDVEADRPYDEGWNCAGNEADHKDLQGDRAGELSKQARAGIYADDADEHHKPEILQDGQAWPDMAWTSPFTRERS